MLRAGELVADRTRADVDDDGGAGVLDRAERLVEQRVVEAELPHLGVQLEDLDAGVDQLGDVGRRLRLGVERRRPQALGHVGREVASPVVEVGRDTRAMGVGQRREASYAEGAELLDALLVAAAVADRPLPADLRARPGRTAPRPAAWMFGGRKCTCTSKRPGSPRSCQKARVARPARASAAIDQSMPLSWRPSACCFSRLACFSASAWRLS